jgi:hypothetical protein
MKPTNGISPHFTGFARTVRVVIHNTKASPPVIDNNSRYYAPSNNGPHGTAQMIGRVMHQPNAQLTHHPILDESHVFTLDQDVTEAVDPHRGLGAEGRNVSQVQTPHRPGALRQGLRLHPALLLTTAKTKRRQREA